MSFSTLQMVKNIKVEFLETFMQQYAGQIRFIFTHKLYFKPEMFVAQRSYIKRSWVRI